MPTNDWFKPEVAHRGSRDGFSAVNDMPSEVAKQKAFVELGSTGLNRWGSYGQVDEEFLQELRGDRGRKTYREMRDNDATIGAILMAIEMLIRRVEWEVQGDDKDQVEFIESCMMDMSHTWNDFIAESLSMLTYGWSWHEIIYKRRQGAGSDPTKRSQFNDGLIGWRKMPIRSQDSLSEWMWDEEGGIQAMVQSAPPSYVRVEIPIERSLLFRVGVYKNNPEGRSLLRNAYKAWWYKKRIEEIEGIGIERDLAGLPVFYATKAVYDQFGDDLKKIGRNLRRDEQECLVLPLIIDPDTKEKELQFELLGSPGQRQIRLSEVIDRYDKRIAMTVLADFLLMGQDKVGSYALSTNKTKLFAASLAAILDSVRDPLNRFAIPRLLALNGMDLETPPQLRYGEIDLPDLEDIARYVTALAGAGMPLFPDDDLENHLRAQVSWPNKPEGLAPPAPKVKKPKATVSEEEPDEEEAEV